MTPRTRLIEDASNRLALMHSRGFHNFTAHDAIESVTDECLGFRMGTIGHEMLTYYRNASDLAIQRLINVVNREVSKS